MWSCNGGASQTWTMNPSGQIIGENHECLQGDYNAPGQGILLWPCNGGSNQTWYALPDHTVRSAMGGTGYNSNVCLAMPPGSNIYSNPQQGLALEINNCDGSTQQQWVLYGNGEFVGAYDEVMEVSGNKENTIGATVDAWGTNGGENQKWTLTPGGWIMTGLGPTGLCLIPTSNVAGATLELEGCTNDPFDGVDEIWHVSGEALVHNASDSASSGTAPARR